MLSHDCYLQMTTRRSVLTAMPGWRLDRTRGDSMHIVNLGVACNLIANTLLWLASQHVHRFLGPARDAALPEGSTLDERLFDLMLRFKRWMRDHRVHCSCKRFTANSLEVTGSTPAYKCKAAQSPRLVAWLHHITGEVAGHMSDNTEALAVSVCNWALAEYFHLLRTGSRFFTDDEATRLNYAGHAFLQSYSSLSRPGSTMWHLVPKFHAFHHIVLDSVSEKTNPRYYHCFGDEDMVGRCLLIARAAHASTTVSSSLGNYCLGLKTRVAGLVRA